MLVKKEIKELVEKNQLVTGYIDLEKQLTPNGFDLTAGEIYHFDSAGRIDFSNKERALPACSEAAAYKKNAEDTYGWWSLKKGVYKVRTNEKVSLPNTVAALSFTRTSLLRMGVFTVHGVWDAGFSGKGEFILNVENAAGVKIKQNARIVQLIFILVKETEMYKGVYNEPDYGDH